MATINELLLESKYSEYSQDYFDFDILINQAAIIEQEIASLDFFIDNFNMISESAIPYDYYFIEDSENTDDTKTQAQEAKVDKVKKKNNIFKTIGDKLKQLWEWILNKLSQFWNWLTKKVEATTDACKALVAKINVKGSEWSEKIKMAFISLRQKFAKFFHIKSKEGSNDENVEKDKTILEDKCTVEPTDKDKICAVDINNLLNILSKITNDKLLTINWKDIDDSLDKICQNTQQQGITIEFDKAKQNRDILNQMLRSVKKSERENRKLSREESNVDKSKEAGQVLSKIRQIVVKTIALYGKAMDYREAAFKKVKGIVAYDAKDVKDQGLAAARAKAHEPKPEKKKQEQNQ